MILWFEGDPATALSELENSDYGNWLNPNNAGEIQFPIINDDQIVIYTTFLTGLSFTQYVRTEFYLTQDN